MPCHSSQGFDCVFHIYIHSAAVFDSHMPCRARAVPMPCHDHAVLKLTSQDHGTARHGNDVVCVNKHRPSKDGMWATCPHSASSGYHAKFREGYYQKSGSRTSSSDISVCHADFHEEHGTAGEWQGRGMACVS
jgi:hypothetical protein